MKRTVFEIMRHESVRARRRGRGRPTVAGRPPAEKLVFGLDTTLSGGSLGSCVDEERSQLRELM